MSVHSTAVIHRGAEIDGTASVGPFCIVGPRVKIGPKTVLMSHVVIDNATTLGAHNIVHPFVFLGGEPQDRKFNGESARLLIGDGNVFRENVTINIGTQGGAMQTTVGNDCLLMANAHIAHDCHVGNGVIMANGVALAGHVELHDFAILGGLAAIHQFCRVGRYAFIGGGSMVAQDVPPFCVAQGDRAMLAGLNLVGLRRAGWPRARVNEVHAAFTQLFYEGNTRRHALEEVEKTLGTRCDEVAELCDFIHKAARGVCGARRHKQPTDDELLA